MDATELPGAAQTQVIDIAALSALHLSRKRGAEALFPDLWVEIFAHTISVDFRLWPDHDGVVSFSTTRRRPPDPSQSLRRISHVCRQWRAIMSEAPQLWSMVVDCARIQPSWFERVLEYAKDYPLQVYCQCTSEFFVYFDQVIRVINGNLHRVLVSLNEFKELHIDLPKIDVGDIDFNVTTALRERFERPMPALNALSFNPGSLRLVRRICGSPTWSNVIKTGFPPALQHLALVDCPFDHTMLTIQHHITYLSITSHQGHEFLPLAILRQTPALEHLVFMIAEFTVIRQEDLIPANGRVKLPCLTRIHLEGRYTVCILLLDALEPAQDLVSLIVHCSYCYRSRRVSDISRLLQRLSTGPPDTMPATIRLGLTRLCPFVHFKTDTGHTFHFVFKFAERPSDILVPDFLWVVDIFGGFFSSCTHLVLEAEEDLNHNNWRDREFYRSILCDLLPRFCNVRALTLTETTYERTLDLLTSDETIFLGLQELLLPYLISSNSGFFNQISTFLEQRGDEIRTLSFPSIYGSHKHTAAKKRAKLLKKLFCVDVVFRINQV